jgi:hypothetical protein
MGYLPQSMNTSIGTPRSNQITLFADTNFQSILKFTLNSNSTVLDLPTIKVSSIVLNE